MKKNNQKENAGQPDFCGEFEIKNEIVFKPGVTYQYSAWEKPKGKISLRIQPIQQEGF